MTAVLAPTAPVSADAGMLAALEGLEAINRDLHHRLRDAHAANLGLREMLAEHGVDAPAPVGVATLARLRALEDVLDLAIRHLRAPSEASEVALRDATATAGRAP